MSCELQAIADRILSAITEKGISYGELSKTTGIPKSALQRYATGETLKIPLDRIQKIALALGVSAAWIMGWDTDDTREKETFALTAQEADLIRAYRAKPELQAAVDKLLLG